MHKNTRILIIFFFLNKKKYLKDGDNSNFRSTPFKKYDHGGNDCEVKGWVTCRVGHYVRDFCESNPFPHFSKYTKILTCDWNLRTKWDKVNTYEIMNIESHFTLLYLVNNKRGKATKGTWAIYSQKGWKLKIYSQCKPRLSQTRSLVYHLVSPGLLGLELKISS